jgi:hypothetical protein
MLLHLAVLVALGGGDSVCPRPSAPTPVSYDEVRLLLAQVVQTSFPELIRAQILLYELKSGSDFFISGLDYETILKKGPTRTYIVYVNPRLFSSPPGAEAIQGVLAHELTHLVDYSRLGPPGILKFVSRYLTRPSAGYERATDLGAMERGYACGLAEYREWLYRQVPPGVRARKQSTYLTPDEIRDWIREHCPSDGCRLTSPTKSKS